MILNFSQCYQAVRDFFEIPQLGLTWDKLRSELFLCCSEFFRSRPPEVFLQKRCYKFTGECPCQSLISMKLPSNFIEITLRQWLFSRKFAAYFQNTFSWEHLWRTTFHESCELLFSVTDVNTFSNSYQTTKMERFAKIASFKL